MTGRTSAQIQVKQRNLRPTHLSNSSAVTRPETYDDPMRRTLAVETSFTAGSARPGINADGSFTWERKTGKRLSAYVTSEDRAVRSNTVTFAAQ